MMIIASTVLLALAMIGGPPGKGRDYEGDWFVADTTNNNTGEREVYAFQVHLEAGDPEYVTLRMRCSKGKPTFFVEWDKLQFPDQAVISIQPITKAGLKSPEYQYVFQRSDDVVESGLRASPETSAKIIADLGASTVANVTSHLPDGIRIVGFEVNGTAQAWSRVVRHCPATIMPIPPK